MSANLRKLTKKDTGDIEAPAGKNDAPYTGPAPRGAIYNPVFIAKAVSRKVLHLLTATDEEDLTTSMGVITLMKDVIIGFVIGISCISVMIFLDHINVIHFQSAHHFRDAAFEMLNDPDTIANLEESSDLKFLTRAQHDAKRKEVDTAAAKVASFNEVLEKRTMEGVESQKELDSLKDEYFSLYNSPLLGLKSYCGSCVWGNKMSCDQRALYLEDTYNTRPIEAKVATMERPVCKGL